MGVAIRACEWVDGRAESEHYIAVKVALRLSPDLLRFAKRNIIRLGLHLA